MGPQGAGDADTASPEMLQERVDQALVVVEQARQLWAGWLQDVQALFPQLQDHSLRASWKAQISAQLQDIF